MNQAKGDDAVDKAEKSKDRIRDHFSRRKGKLDRNSAKQSMLRVALIAVGLCLLILWIFN